MRHYEIGSVDNKDNLWSVRFYKGKYIKRCATFEEAIEKAKEELKRFVDFANEGASFRVATDDGTYYHLLDVEEEGYEEFDLTIQEYFQTHFFYKKDSDDNELRFSKVEIKRSAEQQAWHEAEVVKATNIRTMPQKVLDAKAKELIDEMEAFIASYVKTLK